MGKCAKMLNQKRTTTKKKDVLMYVLASITVKNALMLEIVLLLLLQ